MRCGRISNINDNCHERYPPQRCSVTDFVAVVSAEPNQKINGIPVHPIDELHNLLPRTDVLMDGKSDDSIPLAVADLLIAAANSKPVPNQVNLDAGY